MKLISTHINFLFLLISLSINAQEYVLNLKVIDESDQKPLDGVSIYIKECSCGGITNINGIFSKKLKQSDYTINVDYLGYASEVISVILNKNQNLIVSMKVEEQELSEVVLLAQKRFQNTENAQNRGFDRKLKGLRRNGVSRHGGFDSTTHFISRTV